jgi:hypothetical protein
VSDYYYFTRDTGWGDTLWHLTNALLYCEENKKDMLIDFRGAWMSKGDKNLFNEYFSGIDTDINIITNEDEIDANKKEAEIHNDSKLVIKNPLKDKQDSLRFFNCFKRIVPSESVSIPMESFAYSNFSGNYIVGVHARCSNGEVLPPKAGNSNRFQGERNPIETIFDIFKERIDHVLFDSPRAFLKACDGYKFFIASDSRQFVDLFQNTYPQSIVADRYFAPPGCGTGHEKGEKSTSDVLKKEDDYGRTKIAKEALIDFYLLQETNFLFKNFSRFNEFCLYKGVPNFHINFQEKCY